MGASGFFKREPALAHAGNPSGSQSVEPLDLVVLAPPFLNFASTWGFNSRISAIADLFGLVKVNIAWMLTLIRFFRRRIFSPDLFLALTWAPARLAMPCAKEASSRTLASSFARRTRR